MRCVQPSQSSVTKLLLADTAPSGSLTHHIFVHGAPRLHLPACPRIQASEHDYLSHSREIPAVSYDFGPELFDEAENHEADGRTIVLEFSRVIITCLYVPSSTMNNAVNIEHRRKFDVKLADCIIHSRTKTIIRPSAS